MNESEPLSRSIVAALRNFFPAVALLYLFQWGLGVLALQPSLRALSPALDEGLLDSGALMLAEVVKQDTQGLKRAATQSLALFGGAQLLLLLGRYFLTRKIARDCFEAVTSPWTPALYFLLALLQWSLSCAILVGGVWQMGRVAGFGAGALSPDLLVRMWLWGGLSLLFLLLLNVAMDAAKLSLFPPAARERESFWDSPLQRIRLWRLVLARAPLLLLGARLGRALIGIALSLLILQLSLPNTPSPPAIRGLGWLVVQASLLGLLLMEALWLHLIAREFRQRLDESSI